MREVERLVGEAVRRQLELLRRQVDGADDALDVGSTYAPLASDAAHASADAVRASTADVATRIVEPLTTRSPRSFASRFRILRRSCRLFASNIEASIGMSDGSSGGGMNTSSCTRATSSSSAGSASRITRSGSATAEGSGSAVARASRAAARRRKAVPVRGGGDDREEQHRGAKAPIAAGN